MVDIESEAVRLLEDNGFNPLEPPSGEYLACCVVGARKVRRVNGLRRRALWSAERDEILFRPGLSQVMEDFFLRHEISERVIRPVDLSNEDAEALCDRFAAALTCPAPALRRALETEGRHLARLAKAFRTSQSIIALRLGEVTGSPIALVTNRHVHVRGDQWFQATPEEIRRVSQLRRIPEGLQRLQLTDAPRRVVLKAV